MTGKMSRRSTLFEEFSITWNAKLSQVHAQKLDMGKRKIGSENEIGLVFGKERSHSNLGMATASGSGYPSQG